MSKKEFRINNYMTLRLENGKTKIYVDGKEFRTCKFLLINIPKKDISEYDNLDSIDEIKEYLSNELEGGSERFQIDPVDEFQGHCSNLQAWVENDYDTRILEMRLAFPLLKRLAEVGDPKAQKKYKEEVKKRIVLGIERGFPNVIHYLIEEDQEIFTQIFSQINFTKEQIKKLLELFRDSQEIESYIIQNHILPQINFTKEQVKILLKLMDKEVLRILIHSPKTSSNTLRELTKLQFKDRGEREYVRREIAEHPNTPEVALRELAQDSSEFIRRIIPEHPNTPEDVLTQLAKDDSSMVREGVAQNQNTPPSILKRLAKDEKGEVREAVANNPNASQETLENLAVRSEKVKTIYSDRVRQAVADNPNTPKDILRKLAKDVWINEYVARNPNTPEDVLEELARTNSRHIKGNVARNPNTPEDVLEELARDGHYIVRSNVARNPNTPEDVLEELAEDENGGVKVDIAGNPNTPPKILKELAENNSEPTLMTKIADNTNTPEDVLKKLAENRFQIVRETAKEKL